MAAGVPMQNLALHQLMPPILQRHNPPAQCHPIGPAGNSRAVASVPSLLPVAVIVFAFEGEIGANSALAFGVVDHGNSGKG